MQERSIKIESEKLLERKLVNKVEALGGLCLKLWPVSVNGLPDRMCMLPGGVIFFVEVKTTKQKVRKIQEIIHRKFRALGFKVYILDKSEQINAIIDVT